MNGDKTSRQEKRVMDALDKLRTEIGAYRKLTGTPPLFMKDGEASPLRPDALEGGRLYASRFDMMRDLVSGGTGAEIGVMNGLFSRFLLDEIGAEQLFLYDLNMDQARADVLDDPRTTAMIGDSAANLGKAPDESFDWIYIDGDHRQAGVRRDVQAARKKIKPGGFLVFNDYTPWSVGEVMPYGVMPVVNDLVNEGYPVVALALAAHGYFDIAIRYTPL